MRYKKRRNFNILVLQEVQESIKYHFMTPEKITDFEMTHRIGTERNKKSDLFEKHVS